jgi:predicted RNA-binding Zn-ribbon protein involved in translation (DUF1610 family)
MNAYGPCESCGASWRGSPIPEDQQDLFGNATHFSRQIGIELRGVYDGVVIWKCPDCGVMTHRFSGERVTDEDIKNRLVRCGGLARGAHTGKTTEGRSQ